MLLMLASSAVTATTLNATVAGATTVVWSALDTYKQCCHGLPFHECALATTPDIPARAWSDDSTSPPTVRMIAGSTSYCHMSGPDLLHLKRECAIAFNKTADGDPSHYAADEYLDSPIAFDNGTVVSLVHTEFPGNRFNESGGPDAPYCVGTAATGYPKCWTVSVGLVVSHDWGQTFEHVAPPPAHLVAAVPYIYNQSQLAYGWGDPSNIMLSPLDDFFYAVLWNRHQVSSVLLLCDFATALLLNSLNLQSAMCSCADSGGITSAGPLLHAHEGPAGPKLVARFRRGWIHGALRQRVHHGTGNRGGARVHRERDTTSRQRARRLCCPWSHILTSLTQVYCHTGVQPSNLGQVYGICVR